MFTNKLVMLLKLYYQYTDRNRPNDVYLASRYNQLKKQTKTPKKITIKKENK